MAAINSNSNLVKCISTFIDPYYHTGKGRFIAMCIKEVNNGKTNYIIQEPVSIKNKWTSGCSYGLKPLPKHLVDKYPVGFYSTGSHYKINKEANNVYYIKNMDHYDKTVNNPNYDNRTHTWYSDGLKLKPNISNTQTHLYHL